jgi:hypothetical protein
MIKINLIYMWYRNISHFSLDRYELLRVTSNHGKQSGSEKHARLDRRGAETHLGGSGQALEEIPRRKEGSRESSTGREVAFTIRRVLSGAPEQPNDFRKVKMTFISHVKSAEGLVIPQGVTELYLPSKIKAMMAAR